MRVASEEMMRHMSDDENGTINLFIYGTLKRGQSRHHALKKQRFIDEVSTAPHYRLVSCGEYPGLIRADDDRGLSIHGELWRIDRSLLSRLDAIESVDEQLYERASVTLSRPYESMAVQTYIYLGNTNALPDIGSQW